MTGSLDGIARLQLAQRLSRAGVLGGAASGGEFEGSGKGRSMATIPVLFDRDRIVQ